MAATPCIICVAITGSLPRKENNPAVPISIAEQIESTQEAYEAGASIVHVHVRNEDQTPSSDPNRFALLKEGLEAHCPGMIIQFSTGGRSGAGRERGEMLSLRPDMASLSVGSNNFPTRVYETPPDLVDWLAAEMRKYDVKPEIEAFDTGHLWLAKRLVADGALRSPALVQLCMGVPWGAPDDLNTFMAMVNNVPEDWTFSAFSLGRNQMPYVAAAVLAGGNVRVGLEDSLYIGKGELATSNAEQVLKIRSIVENLGLSVATPAEARERLALKGGDRVAF